MTSGVARVRSALFVPASRADHLARVLERGADAIILDLEDSVPDGRKAAARAAARAWLEQLAGLRSAARGGPAGPAAFARVNPDPPDLDADLAAVVGPGLDAVLLPKVRSSAEVLDLADRLSWHEGRVGLDRGQVRIWPIIETADAVLDARAIAGSSPRVAYMGGATAATGDLEHAIGFTVTPAGLETLFLRSKVLLDVRAAGVPNPMSGLVASLADDDDVEQLARATRGLGYEGMMVLHPRHVAIVNRVFSLTQAELDDAREIVRRFADAEHDGQAVITVGGTIIDAAGVLNARRLLDDERTT